MTMPSGDSEPTPWQRKVAVAQRLAESLRALCTASELVQLALTDWRLEFDDAAIAQLLERSEALIGHIKRCA